MAERIVAVDRQCDAAVGFGIDVTAQGCGHGVVHGDFEFVHIFGVAGDPVELPHELSDVDLGVLKGEVAVAENGCVWVPQTMKERAVMFISQCLVILVDRNSIVSNMHQAYEKIGNLSYGCFISGPSKTADIAQALVMGAQAARDVTVIII